VVLVRRSRCRDEQRGGGAHAGAGGEREGRRGEVGRRGAADLLDAAGGVDGDLVARAVTEPATTLPAVVTRLMSLVPPALMLVTVSVPPAVTPIAPLVVVALTMVSALISLSVSVPVPEMMVSSESSEVLRSFAGVRPTGGADRGRAADQVERLGGEHVHHAPALVVREIAAEVVLMRLTEMSPVVLTLAPPRPRSRCRRPS